MVRATTTAAIAAFAQERLQAMVAQAVRYHGAALANPGKIDRPWPRMIDRLLDELHGIGQLSVFVGAIGDHDAARSIEADIRRTGDRLIALAHEARLASIPGWVPSGTKAAS